MNPPDFQTLFAGVPCWDADVQRIFLDTGEPRVDVALQNRRELEAFAAFMWRNNVRSYLEIGTWTGRTACALHAALNFDVVAVCDHGYAQQLGLPLHVPQGAHMLRADSDSREFLDWRESLGHIDLVLIDANHRYDAVRRDFDLNRTFPHRFLAFHDITGSHRATVGVRRLWDELEGAKHEIVLPHDELGLPHSTMGIGVWAANPP
jgi:hypothetical protein